MKVLSFSLAISRHALCVSALTVALVVASCASTPAPEPVQAPEPVPVPLSVTEERPELVPPPPPPPPQAEPVEEKPAPEPVKKPFDPKAVSQEEYNRTKEDIQAFITNLNNIIRQRNFTAWLGDLSESYRESLESPANLAKYNRSPRLSSTGVELRNIQDFFN
jgi:outer membrane biosynthesis protein TonB